MRFAAPSVRARLTLWHAGVLTLVICIFSVGIFGFVRSRLYGELDQQIGHDLATIEKVYLEETGDLGELAHRMGITLFQVSEDGTILYQTPGWPPTGTTPYRLGTFADRSHRITAARAETTLRQTLWTLAVILISGVPCAIGLAIGGGYFLAGRMLSPVGTLADTARKITAESLTARLPVENPRDEFGQLAIVFNDTLSRLEEAFEQLRRFTADASHELRTPLTAIRSVGEVALQRSLNGEGYREVIGSMLEEVDRLTRLVESLLTLTRGESGRIQPALQTVNLSGLVASVVEHLRVLAEEKEQGVTIVAAAEVSATCDPAILRLGLINVLDNAIKYTADGGTIRVKVAEMPSGEAAIEIQDSGPGISAPHHERIFERFYRVDEGRSREAGGAGLGLATARWAVEVNGGRIELESEEGKGSLFRIVLPRGGDGLTRMSGSLQWRPRD
jgi:heavy metal sensor kinase